MHQQFILAGYQCLRDRRLNFLTRRRDPPPFDAKLFRTLGMVQFSLTGTMFCSWSVYDDGPMKFFGNSLVVATSPPSVPFLFSLGSLSGCNKRMYSSATPESSAMQPLKRAEKSAHVARGIVVN